MKENTGENFKRDRTCSNINHEKDKQITVNPHNLLDKTWQPITTGKLPKNTPGLYLIGKFCNLFVIPLYLGRSNDIRRRLNEHLKTSQKYKQRINNYIQSQIKDSIMVKWICDHNQKTTEEIYLNYAENYFRFKLTFNMTAGDGAARFRRPRSCLFRPTTTNKKIRPFPSRQRKPKKAISFRDVQLGRQIRGLAKDIN